MRMSITTKRAKEIRRKIRRKFSSEEKIRIVLDGWKFNNRFKYTNWNYNSLCSSANINCKNAKPGKLN
jgi:hypothetical protein